MLNSAHEVILDAFGPDKPDIALRFLKFSLEKEKSQVFNLLDFFILKKDQEIIGVMGIVSLGYDPQEVGWVCYPGVKKKFQNQGLGSKLLVHLVRFAKRRGIKRLYTDTSYPPDGIQARSFYTKNGFEPSGEMKDFFIIGQKTQYFVKYL